MANFLKWIQKAVRMNDSQDGHVQDILTSYKEGSVSEAPAESPVIWLHLY